MAVAWDNETESHTGTTGSASVASFSWTHTPTGTPRGVLVFTFVNANADDATSVTYGGVAMTAVSGGRAVDTVGEPGDCKAWFLGASIPTGNQTVVVNRTNNANVMYATAFTVTAGADTAVAGVTLLQEDGTVISANVNDGSPGTDSVRFGGINTGTAAIPNVNAASTPGPSIDFGARCCATGYELTAGQGSRSVGWNAQTSDDRACVLLAVREVAAVALAPRPTVISQAVQRAANW